MTAAGARGPLAIATVLLLATSVSTFHEPTSAGSYSRQNKQESNAEFSSPFNDHYKGRETWTATGNSPIEMDEVQGKELRIFCWEGLPLDIRRLWYTAYFLLDIKDDSFHLYKGVTTQEVKDQYKSSSRFFAFLPWKDRNVRLNCFSPTCLGVYTNKSYTLTLSVNPVDPLRLGMFIAGVILVLFARKMSRNSVFHYGSGISVALLGSLLVVIFLVSRMIPRKAFGASFLIGGWAMVLYFLRTMWTNFRETLLQHRNYVATYVTLVSGLTFLLIYRFGGVRNPRTMDILQWIMQFLGAALIYLSCTIEVVGVALVVAITGLDLLLRSGYVFRRIRLFNWLFPPRPRKLLSQAEYDAIGRRETEKALEELRQYCASPQCNSWSLVKKLSTPARFSSFVDEGTHLTPDEVDFYERESSFDGADEEDDQSSFPPLVPLSNGSSAGRHHFSSDSARDWNGSRNSPRLPNDSGRFSQFSSRHVEPMDFE